MKDYDDIITIDNEEYIVIDELQYENSKYIYVINSKNEEKVTILKETEENGETYIESVPKDKVELFMNLFAKKFLETKEA
jgi:hypothetical protein